MDDIEFRAWHEENKDFVYFDLKALLINGYWVAQSDLHKGELKSDPYVYREDLKNKKDWFKMNCNPEQYTGLKDIFTDQKCYVNDLIDWYDRHKDKIVRFKVIFMAGCFCGQPIDRPNITYQLSILLSPSMHSEAGKIVGNIHE